METGTIEREIHIDASPEVVFDVVSNPEHVSQWWPDEADYPAEPGGAGRIGFRQESDTKWEQFMVVDALPPRHFSFRWTHAEGETPAEGNSFLVVFELEKDEHRAEIVWQLFEHRVQQIARAMAVEELVGALSQKGVGIERLGVEHLAGTRLLLPMIRRDAHRRSEEERALGQRRFDSLMRDLQQLLDVLDPSVREQYADPPV